MSTMSSVFALIFAKYPSPGAVKTRMVPPLTPEEATALHESCLRAVCANLRGVRTLATKLVVTPDERANELGRRLNFDAASCWPQGDGDLGHRLSHATTRAFDEGARGVVLLGADSPTIPRDDLEQAIDCLTRNRVVLGPCDDGGYYLLGLPGPMPELFEGVAWGGPHVADQTRRRARLAGVDLVELPCWYDLDRFTDLRRAAEELRAMDLSGRPEVDALRQSIDTLLCKCAEREA